MVTISSIQLILDITTSYRKAKLKKFNLLSTGSSLFLFFTSTTFIDFGDSTTGVGSFTMAFSFVDSTVTKADLEENIAGADLPVSMAASCEGGEKNAADGLKL